MTDTEKINLIYKITCSVIECVDFDKSSMDAFTCCICDICEFKSDPEKEE